ncbi:MAG: hypothetical protein ACRCTY_08535, partial [Candidatus Adiutrix sp.]
PKALAEQVAAELPKVSVVFEPVQEDFISVVSEYPQIDLTGEFFKQAVHFDFSTPKSAELGELPVIARDFSAPTSDFSAAGEGEPFEDEPLLLLNPYHEIGENVTGENAIDEDEPLLLIQPLENDEGDEFQEGAPTDTPCECLAPNNFSPFSESENSVAAANENEVPLAPEIFSRPKGRQKIQALELRVTTIEQREKRKIKGQSEEQLSFDF